MLYGVAGTIGDDGISCCRFPIYIVGEVIMGFGDGYTRVVAEVPDLTKKKNILKKKSLFLYIVSF
jgi:hypothetical protein